MKIHTIAWTIWLSTGLVILLSNRNPLYLLIADLILIIFQIWITPAGSRVFSATLRLGTTILLLSTFLNMVISRFGETVLFRLPDSIPLLGGPYTLESMIYGLTNGLILIGIFSLFTILNRVVSVRSLMRLIPQAFHPMAVITSIAITFIPASQKQFQAIREAQSIRGQEVKKIKDWLPLIIPMLIGGLERAMQIAEAMTARGFTAQTDQKPLRVEKIALAVGLVLILLGWVLDLGTQRIFSGWRFIALGLLLLLSLFFASGWRKRKTVYTKEPWTLVSSLISVLTLTTNFIFLFLSAGRGTLNYDPYPVLRLPEFSLLHGFSILTLLTPLFFIKENQFDQD